MTVTSENASGPVVHTVAVNGTSIPVTAGVATFTDTAAIGTYNVLASAFDGVDNANTTATFNVRDPSDVDVPVVDLITPETDDEITAPFDALGTVTDANLASYILAIAPAGSGDFTTLATGSTNVTSAVVGTIDPTQLQNGLYTVVLQATDSNGQMASESAVIEIDGDLKVGNFSFTVEDINIPVSGIPIRMTRTYDTRQKDQQLDFGHGWSVDYQDVRAQESRPAGAGWFLEKTPSGPFSNFCIKPLGRAPRVSVRLPDGELEVFEAVPFPQCNAFFPIVDVTLSYRPVDSTFSTLTQTTAGSLRFIGDELVDLGAPGPVDADAYRLTTEEGFEYALDQDFGVRSVTDPNGNTLTFDASGVSHSDGKGLTFTRDSEGRITHVTDPQGEELTYTYNAAGDLETFTDRESNVTTYTYNTEHALTDIDDPLGHRIARQIYDPDGRLIKVIDADGNEIVYTHDITGRLETVLDRRGNPTIFAYDDRGNVLTETNALGETITRTYNAEGDELTTTNALGHTTTFTYDARGNQLSEEDPLGNVTTSTYDSRNQLLTLIDESGDVAITNTYDGNGNLSSMTDALGQVTSFAYDSRGNLTTVTDPLMQTTISVYDGAGNKIEETDVRGTVTEFEYDDNGNQTLIRTTRTDELGAVVTLETIQSFDDGDRLTSSTDALGNNTTTEYDGNDKETATIDGNSNRTEFEYDDRGNLVLTRFPDLTTETVGYDEEGNRISETDRLGRTTKFVYDAANRLTDTIFPDLTPGTDADNPRTINEYDLAGRLTATINERGERTEFSYDAAGRRLTTTDALLNVTTFTYDAKGNRKTMLDARGNTTTFTYDDANRLTRTTFADATHTDTVYDSLGRKVSETDQAGLTTLFGYDPAGNLVSVTDAVGEVTSFGYDEQGNKITQTDALTRTTEWAYDNGGRVIRRTLPLGQDEIFTYDRNGNRLTRTDFNGDATAFVYDNTDRLTTINYPDTTSVTMTYTDTGQRQTVTDSRGVTTYGYDERERLTSIAYPNGQVISYSYDAAGNRTSVTTLSGTTDSSFDALNRLETVTDPNSGVTTYTYDPNGNRATITYPNGVASTYTYDTLNRLTDLHTTDSTAATVNRFTYTLGLKGNRVSVFEHTGRIVDYDYDDLYRLVQESVTDSVNGDRTSDFTYDAVGNRLTQDVDGVVTTYSYDMNDRLDTETTGAIVTTYAYDDNGNTLNRDDGSTTTTYAYDFENRMTSQTVGLDTTTYAYDVDNIRQSQVDAIGTTQYVVDPNRPFAQVLEELDGTSLVIVSYVYGDDLLSQDRGGVESFYLYDGLGSTRSLTDNLGVETDSYIYTAFGETEVQVGSTENSYLYTGEQFDSDLGFYYLRARYLNPGVGRFHSMDSFAGVGSDPVTLHKYLYGNGDPANMIDRSGYFSIGEAGGINLILGISLTSATPSLAPFAIRAVLGTVIGSAGVYLASNHSAKLMIQQCLEDSKAGGNKCRPDFSIFVVGDSHDELRDHVADAQDSGSPSLVTRGAAFHSRGWITKLRNAGVVCTGEGQCDEYPMAIHEEGGEYGITSLRSVNAFQNQSIGGMVPRFHERCKVNVGEKYKFVPVRGVPISGGICSGRN